MKRIKQKALRRTPWTLDKRSSTYGPCILDREGYIVAELSNTYESAGPMLAAAPQLIAAIKAVVIALDGSDEAAMDAAEELCREALKSIST